jgi:hypothetical protein
MTEPRTPEPFETLFADRVRTYADAATARPVDALAVARAAMSSPRAAGWPGRRVGGGWLDRRIAGVPMAVAAVAVILISVVAIALLGAPSSNRGVGTQPTASVTPSVPAATVLGLIPDVLLHAWERPYAVHPDLVDWPTGSLRLESGLLHVGPEPGDTASTFAVTAAGSDTIAVATDSASLGCSVGDVGTYRWSVEGKGTVLTLTATVADACAEREAALAGSWVRSDLPGPQDDGTPWPPGTYETSGFDPFDAPALFGQLSYTIPDGWKVKDDRPRSFVLHRLPDGSQGPSTDTMVFLLAQPALAADFEEGATCDPVAEAPGVGQSVDDLVAAILARPGVVSTPPKPVTIGGYEGQMLDLRLAPSWTGGCLAPDGPVVSMPILVLSDTAISPVFAIAPGMPLRLILLDLSDGRTMAAGIFTFDPSAAPLFDDLAAAAMPVIESFEFHPPAP